LGTAVLNSLEREHISRDAVQVVGEIAHFVESNMGGVSGALYAIFPNALAYHLRVNQGATKGLVTPKFWRKALQSAQEALSRYTPAIPGYRTLIDSLHLFVQSIAKDVVKTATAAQRGCDSTKGMEASLGHSVYVGGDDWKTKMILRRTKAALEVFKYWRKGSK
jgi:dihydroxyacetone kinase